MGSNVREYIKREHITRILIAVGVVLLLDVIGVGVFLFSRGQWHLASFADSLAILLLVEGSIVGSAGGFVYVGYSEYRIARQHAINPYVVGDQRRRWGERRLSQRKWGMAMLVAGGLLILLFFFVSFLTSL